MMNIIQLMKEAGAEPNYILLKCEALERFAALVRAESAKEDLEVLENLRKETIARCEAGMIEAYQLGRAEALEEAAKVCDDKHDYMCSRAAAAIRARSEK